MPEPGPLVLFGLGLAALGLRSRRAAEAVANARRPSLPRTGRGKPEMGCYPPHPYVLQPSEGIRG